MPQYLSPGVYVEEVPSAIQTIAGVGTSTAGFIGVVPDSITIPKPFPPYNPMLELDATIAVDPKVENLLGATLAEEVALPPTELIPAGTVLNLEQAQAMKARGGSALLVYEQDIGAALLDKTLAEDVLDGAGDIIRITVDGDEIELRKGHTIITGEVTPIRDALTAAGIQIIKLEETVDLATEDADYLVGKTLVQDFVLEEGETLAAGTVVAGESTALGIIQALSPLAKVQVKNSLYVTLAFSSPVVSGQVKLCTSFAEFKKSFGDFSSDADQNRLAHGVFGFFNNGGTRCYVMRYATLAGLQNPTALKAFEAVDEIALVAAPGISDATVQTNLLNHCTGTQDRFAILDSAETIDGDLTPDIIDPPDNNNYGGFYLPWIQVFDPATKVKQPDSDGRIFVGPGGHLAGVYARVDTERGVHKAPANEVVRGALDVKYPISKAVQDGLNPHGINCIRDLNGNIRVWGARTIGGDANGEWKYINVRRLFLFLRESIDEGTQWVVFEPNTPELWSKITRNVTAFLTNVWRAGALFGTTPQEAFYVKCDAETNPPEVRDLGRVVTEIGVAVVKPAEFVIFRISQWAGLAG